MKYEGHSGKKVEDVIDVIIDWIVKIIFAPLVLMKNVSLNLLFLGKYKLQLLSTAMMVVQGFLILINLILMISKGQFSLMTGTPPLFLMLLVFGTSIFLINWLIDQSESISSQEEMIEGVEFSDLSQEEEIEDVPLVDKDLFGEIKTVDAREFDMSVPKPLEINEQDLTEALDLNKESEDDELEMDFDKLYKDGFKL